MLFENNKGGCRIATSVGSVATGKGGNIIVVDDGNNVRDGESEIKRESTNSWWDQVLSTRLNNPLRDVRIVVQQRLHEKDMSGHIIANDIESEWVKLIIPMEFEEKRKAKTVILPSTNGSVWEDPRTKDGELLWPERFPSNIINRLQRELGSYGYAGQYQQRPSPLSGGILQKDWFKKWEHPYLPRFDYIIQSWDTAFSDSQAAAYSACTTWGVWGENSEEGLYKVILVSMWRDRVGYPDLRARAQRLAKDYKDVGTNKNLFPATRYVDTCLIEAKSTGDQLIRDLRNAGVPAIGYIPKGDKTSRVQRVAASIECGLIYLPTEEKNKDRLLPFADEFLESVITFPNAESRDLVDTMTQVLSYLKDRDCLIHPTDEKEEEIYRKPRKLY
jgi:predicted phage terminase large subunit-like protein